MDLDQNPKLTECLRCKHVWKRRKALVDIRACPKCKSPYWNKPRRDA